MVQFIKNYHDLIFQNFRVIYFRAMRGDMGIKDHFYFGLNYYSVSYIWNECSSFKNSITHSYHGYLS